MRTCWERRKTLGSPAASRRAEGRRAAGAAAAGASKAVLDPPPGPRDLDHPGLRALPDPAAARQGPRSADGAHPRRRGADLRHGGPVPPDRHLQPRPARTTARSRQGPGDVLPRRQGARCCRRASTSRRHGLQLDRRGHLVFVEQPDPWCRSSSLYSMFGFSASATWRGRPATCSRAASCSAAPRAHDLNGEGLQHEDGHSHILAGTIPNCISYDPTFAHEVAVILHHGVKRDGRAAGQRLLLPDAAQRELSHARPPAGDRGADHQGHVPASRRARRRTRYRASTSGSGNDPAREHGGAELLDKEFGVAANVWSCPSFNELPATARTPSAGTCCTRRPKPRQPFVAQQLDKHAGPVVAATDYMKNYAEQIRAFMPRADVQRCSAPTASAAATSAKLREHFEVNRHYIVVAALKALADEGTVPAAKVAEAIQTALPPTRSTPARLSAHHQLTSGLASHGDASLPAKPPTETSNHGIGRSEGPDIGDFRDVESSRLLVEARRQIGPSRV